MIQQFLANRRAAWSVTAALLVSFTVFAPAESQAEGYIGASVGQSYIDLDAGTPAVPAAFDEEDFGWKAMIGYEFGLPSVTLGVEASYVDFGAPSGDVAGSQIEVDANGFAAFGTAGIDLGPLGVFAKFGMISWDASFNIDGFDAGSDDGTDPAYGVGVEFGLASVEVRGEYEIYDVEDSDDVSMLSVGIIWRF
ncbi:MAG: porin family protein [Gammaproteobacteria bacterium]|nr:porin family protein [Gammaproteobacteria bacterium]